MKILQFSGKLQTHWFIILIAAVVLACYLPALHNGFVWDDHANLIENFNYRGLSFAHLHWMFTTIHDANYHPLIWLTLAVDFVLWGMNPAGYHLTNIVLHTFNAVLFYFLVAAFLRRETAADPKDNAFVLQTGAAVGALFFALHPLRVEPVVGVSIRGDVLCGFFYLLTVIAYLRMNESRTAAGRRKWFLLSLLFFIFSLLSRAWGITLPLVLLILDAYPLRRFDVRAELQQRAHSPQLAAGLASESKNDGIPYSRRFPVPLQRDCRDLQSISSFKKVLLEKIPFAFFALSAGILAFWAKRGSMLMVAKHGLMDRFVQATYGLCFYIVKTIAPIRLSPLYLLEKDFNPIEPKYILSALLVLGIILGLIAMRHRWPWALTAWVCYAVIVSPLLGFVQSGPQIAADRYTYIACMPFAILAGAGMQRLGLARQNERLFSVKRFAVMAFIWAGLLVLAVASSRHTHIWHNDLSFWNQALRLDPGHYIAYNNRGYYCKNQRGPADTLNDYNNAIRLNPEYDKAYFNRGNLLMEQGDLAGALKDYNTLIRLDPNHARTYYNRGNLLKEQGDLAGALKDYNFAIRLNPEYSQAYNNRGLLYKEQSDFAGADKDFTAAIRLNPLSPEIYCNRGLNWLSQNNFKAAFTDFTKALEVAPENWPDRGRLEHMLYNIRLKLKQKG
jgi:tetratricopeptide (TPR) repeat protein